jgi:hypothetical protein
LKIARRTFFFSGLVRGRDFLALVDLEAVSFEGMFFAIVITRFIPAILHLSSGSGAVTEESGKRATPRCPFKPHH